MSKQENRRITKEIESRRVIIQSAKEEIERWRTHIDTLKGEINDLEAQLNETP